MQTIGIASFEEQAAAFDHSVTATPKISTFCSGSDWILSAHKNLHPPRETLVYEDEDHWLTLTQGPLFHLSNVIQPMESAWCFSCPLIGPNPRHSVSLLLKLLRRRREDISLLLLGGIPRGSKMHADCYRYLGKFFRIQAFPGSDCCEASLKGGADGYLSRRSVSFRASLRSGMRKAIKEGVDFEHLSGNMDGISILNRVLSVEMRSWKHGAGESVFRHHDHYQFYRDLIKRTAGKGLLRAVFAKREGEDIAYVIGGILGRKYRGFQMGFDASMRTMGAGNLVQFELIEALCDEGVEYYDLGMDMNYKRRWAENRLEFVNLLVTP